jgi:hypothetical protein
MRRLKIFSSAVIGALLIGSSSGCAVSGVARVVDTISLSSPGA